MRRGDEVAGGWPCHMARAPDVGDAARPAVLWPAVSWCAANVLVVKVPGIQAEAG
jgi:hypothetical protein